MLFDRAEDRGKTISAYQIFVRDLNHTLPQSYNKIYIEYHLENLMYAYRLDCFVRSWFVYVNFIIFLLPFQ